MKSKLVISPGTRVRWVNGEIEISTGDSRKYHRTPGVEIIDFLNEFALPVSIEDVVNKLSDVDEDDISDLVDEFLKSGVLVPEGVDGIEVFEDELEEELFHIVEEEEATRILSTSTTALPGLQFDDFGLTVSNCGKEKLSLGCQSCKDGGWICFYPSFKCNAHCVFCPQSAGQRHLDFEELGTEYVDELIAFLRNNCAKVTGLSISGGELFLNADIAQKMLLACRNTLPHVYRWAYTNGIAATSGKMKALHDAGLDEIRFNWAATSFDTAVFEQIENAVEIFPWVTVEVPSTEEVYQHLVKKDGLSALCTIGVKQLNLAQLTIPNRAQTSPVFQSYAGSDEAFYRLSTSPSGGSQDLYSLDSRLRTYKIFEHAHQNDLDIRMNDCSCNAKEVQQLARKARWGAKLRRMKLLSYPHPVSPSTLNTPPVNAHRTQSGLVIQTLNTGSDGRRPGPNSHVSVKYAGWTTDGELLDSSYTSPGGSRTFSLNNVIRGWAEGLQLMTEGEKCRLWIPEELAYGQVSGKPQGNLVFDIELLKIWG